MRIEAKDLRDTDRVNIGEAFPLDVPLLLYIEPTNLCNLRCKICPTGHAEMRALRSNGTMSYDFYTELIDDLLEFPHEVRRINFYKDGEPLLHKQFPEMVKYAKQSGVARELWTKTNGLMLNPELNQRLVACGLDMIGISINHVTEAGYHDACEVWFDYNSMVANITDLYSRREGMKVYIKLANTGLSDSEIQKFYDDFEGVSDYCAIEGLHGWAQSEIYDFKQGQTASFEGIEAVDKIACPLPFAAMAINWNGLVSPCNEDWRHKCIIGDAKQDSLHQIWTGAELCKFRMMHLAGRRGNNIMCARCDYMRCLPDNIDKYRMEMLKRL